MFIKKIKSKDGELLAKVYSHKLKADGVSFLTEKDYPLQIGLIQHREDKVIRPHKHAKIVSRVECQVQEFIYVEKGKVKVKVYDDDFRLVETTFLRNGDSMLQIAGGHEFLIYKGARLIEVKQGPYLGDDKAKIYKD